MKLIQRTDLTGLRTMDFFQTQADTAQHLRSENLQELQLQTVCNDVYFPAVAALDEALKPMRKTGLTDPLLDLDSRRDAAITGFNAHVRAYMQFPETAKSQAAHTLKLITDKYGKGIQTLPLREETAVIASLLQDLAAAEAQAALALIGAEAYVAQLTEANTEFERVYNDRTRLEAAMETGRTRTARIALQEAFNLLASTINALSLLNGDTLYLRLAANINREVQQALATVKQRAADRKNNTKDTPGTT